MQGPGSQNFLNGLFTPVPNLVFVNGLKQEATHQCDLEHGDNRVILAFNTGLQSCEQMFKDCVSIKENIYVRIRFFWSNNYV